MRLATPHPCPPGLAPVRVCCAYDGAARAALVAYKDGERRDLAGALAPLLAVPLVVALDALPGRRAAVAGGPVVVPVPSSRTSRRRRGDLPLHALAARATRLLPAGQRPLVVEALRVRRRVADQAGLGAQARWANLHGAFELRPSALPMLRAAAAVVLVDDVLTTGATLAEAQRVLTGSTTVPLALVAIAATSRRPRGDLAARSRPGRGDLSHPMRVG